MRLPHRPLRAGGAAVLGLATIALTGAFAGAQASTAAPASNAAPSAVTPLVAIKNSLPATTDRRTGAFTAAKMSVEVSLAPRNETGLNAELKALYTKGSGQYGKFLAKGQFDTRYAPTAATRDAVTAYLRGEGLAVSSTDSPFLIRATGSSAKITAAFHTGLSNFVDPRGTHYYSNSASVRLPASVASAVEGVVGLTNTERLQASAIRPATGTAAKASSNSRAAAKSGSSSASCETGYVTTAELFDLVSNGTNFPYGYGGGPGCSGLTPSQTNSMYGAPFASPRTEGAGVTAAVFELSAYQQSDIGTWAHYFYGRNYNPPLTDVTVDGGPLAPVCPAGDTCPPEYEGYSGDIEVDADIEMSLAVAPDVKHLIVYNAPNDYTGQTELDEYTTIANQDVASTISSSWGECENDAGASYAQAENTVFEQIAAQGQSLFSSSGDTGAFGCIRSDGTTVLNVNDPASQPWVTSVGGTSFEGDNPGTNSHPGTPAKGDETVWNVDNLCSDQAPAADNDNQGGFFWCAETGAGGGGSSQFWGRPFYQHGPGVTSKYTTHSGESVSNGETACTLATAGTPCRETPDISANADPYTGYAEYCTGSASTPYSYCATFSAGEPAPGWFGIGGTSLSSPLWAALIADRDSFTGHRSGNINPLLYTWFQIAPGAYFNDITGNGRLQQAATNNGLYPTTPGYDEATGIGSPKFAAVITGF
ncbi:MAG: S53 family peptidase [Trebonia sp.]|jgi:subtilase family serine protease